MTIERFLHIKRVLQADVERETGTGRGGSSRAGSTRTAAVKACLQCTGEDAAAAEYHCGTCDLDMCGACTAKHPQAPGHDVGRMSDFDTDTDESHSGEGEREGEGTPNA